MAQDSYLREALDILSSVPLIDGHNDWAMYIRENYGSKLDDQFLPEKDLTGHNDIKRLRAGKSGGVFWSAYVGCPEPENDFRDQTFFETMRDTMQQIDLIHRFIERYDQHLELVTKASDILEIFQRGKIASMIGIEGLHQIANSASVLRNYYRLGARYITLTHNLNNKYADCAVRTDTQVAKKAVHEGLSEDGKAMVREMNRVGLMVDLSHVSDQVMVDAIEVSRAPVAFTHSSCFAICPHPRNVPDNVLKLLKANNGIVMISFVPKFTNVDPAKGSLDDVIDHILHAAKLIGFEHIGIGSDFDGMAHGVIGLENVSRYPQLVSRMLERGVERANIERVLGWNVIRVMEAVEAVRDQMKGEAALEDEV